MYRVEMIVGGRKVRKVKNRGRFYLPVEMGEEFSIRIYNDTSRRVVAVVSVDGKSVMNGNIASHNDGGYIVESYNHIDINGWRRGNDEVASFEVSNKESSYAGKTVGETNCGVIGVVIYPEIYRKVKIESQPHIFPIKPYKEPWIPKWEDSRTYSMTTQNNNYGGQHTNSNRMHMMSCSIDDDGGSVARRISASQQAGTAYGESKEDHVYTANFERDTSGKQIITLYYNSPHSLRERGILSDSRSEPSAFPAEDEFYGNYCEPPR